MRLIVTATQTNKLLIKERVDRGLTQQQFAELIGISQSLLSQLENGTKEPSFTVAKKISLIVNVEIGRLFKKYQL